MTKKYFRLSPYLRCGANEREGKVFGSYNNLPLTKELRNRIMAWVGEFKYYIEHPRVYYNINKYHRCALKIKEEVQLYLGDEWKIICCSKEKLIEYLSEELSDIASYHKNKKEYSEAIVYYKQILRLDGDNYEILNDIAFCHYSIVEYSEASHYLKKIITHYNSDATAFFNLGICMRQLNEFALAGIYLEKALSLNTGKLEYIIYFSRNLIDLGLYKDAIEILKPVSLAIKENKQILDMLASAYFYSEKYREAIELLNEVMSIYPNDSKSAFRLAMSYAYIKELDKSTQYFLGTLKIDPGYGECYFNIALNYHIQEQDHLSVDMYVRALMSDSKFAEHFWGEDKLLLSLNIADDFKLTILTFGSENGDERARNELEGSNLCNRSAE